MFSVNDMVSSPLLPTISFASYGGSGGHVSSSISVSIVVSFYGSSNYDSLSTTKPAKPEIGLVYY